MARQLLWGAWVRVAAQMDVWALPPQSFPRAQSHHGDGPSPDFPPWYCPWVEERHPGSPAEGPMGLGSTKILPGVGDLSRGFW